jgi:predicted enzyme related to lactoylglutathione lyase
VVDGVLLEIADLDAVLGRARDAGAEVLRGPEQQPPGRLATVADPEGHRWMLLEPLPESR